MRNQEERIAHAYVDGSYNHRQDICGYGVVFFDEYGTKCYIKGKSNYWDRDINALHNVGGEIMAVLEVLNYITTYNIKKVLIYYDYEGIEKWVTGEWRANKRFTKYYRDSVKKVIDEGYDISFIHVKAHSGDKWNEKADQLAKIACGIVVKDI